MTVQSGRTDAIQYVQCTNCHGKGYLGNHIVNGACCPICEGRGGMNITTKGASDMTSPGMTEMLQYIQCPKCKGKGRYGDGVRHKIAECEACNGKGALVGYPSDQTTLGEQQPPLDEKKKKVASEAFGTFDTIHHPSHYNAGAVEVIDAIEAWQLNFNLGNAVKYIARHEHKNVETEDLLKAWWYLTRELLSQYAVTEDQLQKTLATVIKKK